MENCTLDPSSADAMASMKGLRVLLARSIRIGVYKTEKKRSKLWDLGFGKTMETEEWSKIVQSNKKLVLFRNVA